MNLRDLHLVHDLAQLGSLPPGKLLIDTVNTHSFVLAQEDPLFEKALRSADALIPDGIGIVKACRWLKMENAPGEKIAGADLFAYEMERLNASGGTCFFMGSSPAVLERIVSRAASVYPNIRIETYSPPYKPAFTPEENQAILDAVNSADPDLLWIGMTAPKQEKWLYENWEKLRIQCHAGAIGAVFDFFAGTVNRAPRWWLDHNLEWLYRLLREPGRMWRRNLVSGPKFLRLILREKMGSRR